MYICNAGCLRLGSVLYACINKSKYLYIHIVCEQPTINTLLLYVFACEAVWAYTDTHTACWLITQAAHTYRQQRIVHAAVCRSHISPVQPVTAHTFAHPSQDKTAATLRSSYHDHHLKAVKREGAGRDTSKRYHTKDMPYSIT